MIVKDKLEQIGEFLTARILGFKYQAFVDNGPLADRNMAYLSGLGYYGVNAHIITDKYGSYVFIGYIINNYAFEADKPMDRTCIQCGRCVECCPGCAILGNFDINPLRCRSFITQKKGELTEQEENILRKSPLVYGCDICQDVCPWNSKAPIGTEPGFAPRTEFVNPALDWLASLDADGFREAFRKSPIKRAKLNGVRRNVVTAMGNSGRLEFEPTLRKIALDDDAAVAEHARWALKKLGIKDDEKSG
jgi:epoxyqueuosine reductase